MEYGKIIALNRMYNGSYLTEGNLGHEVINLYKSDNNNDYIYLPFSGKFDKKHHDKFGCVLLVRGMGQRRLEIIGKAEQLEEVYGQYDQKSYIKKEKITYSGVLLDLLFSENTEQQEIFITFKAKTTRPLKPIYIQYGGEAISEDTIVLKETNQAKTSLRQYITTEAASDYQKLLDIINDTTLWDKGIEKVNIKNAKSDNRLTMFDICGIQYSELAYSHSLYHFLNTDPEFASYFVVNVLGVKEGLVGAYNVYRERDNIDLYIEDAEKAIIIENKIKSSINGVFIDEKKAIKDSQLDRYIEKIEERLATEEKVREIVPFLLAPNYNKIDISEYNLKKKYAKIFYSDLYEHMKKYKSYKTDFQFKELTNALVRHASEYNNELFEAMTQRFVKLIEKKLAVELP